MSPHPHLRLALLLALALPAAPAMAVAQPAQPTEQAKAAARALAGQGWEHFQAGRYEEALAAFRDAEALVHAPSLLYQAARSCERLGRLIEARSFYQRIVDEPLAASAPRAYQQAQADAKVELAALAPRIPSLEVTVTGASTSAVALTLDGQRIDPALPVERDPGNYTLVAVVPGHTPVTRTIQLKEGAREQVTLDLTPPPAAAPVTDRPAAPSGTDTRRAVLVGGGITAGAAVLAGIAFTLVANSKAGDAERQGNEVDSIGHGPGSCSSPAEPSLVRQCDELSARVDDQYLFSNLALWGFVSGGAAALGTLGYYWLAPPPSESRKQMRVLPLVTLGGGGIVAGGSF
ncbi:tetratricopeptide repeat protein [Sorangium sp. So ce131]|uniref:tetratricopeptide repeat protein n=1 Tax=Sorangium sp. So ce131 TaxID=3133282 RepID=UPI003F60F708